MLGGLPGGWAQTLRFGRAGMGRGSQAGDERGSDRVQSPTVSRKGGCRGHRTPNPTGCPSLLPGTGHPAQGKGCSLLAAKAPWVRIAPRQGRLVTGRQQDRTPGETGTEWLPEARTRVGWGGSAPCEAPKGRSEGPCGTRTRKGGGGPKGGPSQWQFQHQSKQLPLSNLPHCVPKECPNLSVCTRATYTPSSDPRTRHFKQRVGELPWTSTWSALSSPGTSAPKAKLLGSPNKLRVGCFLTQQA